MKNKTGKITKEADGFRVQFERVYKHNIQIVWDAITNPEKLKLWFTDFKLELKPGSHLTIIFRDDQKTETYGKVVSVEPPHKFAYTWEGELAEWELFPLDEHTCKLIFTYSKLDEAYAINAPAGFHSLLDRLEEMLQGSSAEYAFGTEENDPEIIKLYEEEALKNYPYLKKYLPVVIEMTYNASVEKVWKAITDKDQMREWYFELEEFKPEVGFEFEFVGHGHKGEKYVHLCEITEVEPLKKLKYSWSYKGFDGISYVTFALEGNEENTKLTLTHEGLHTFPAEHPDFGRESFNQGWTELMGKLLKDFVEKF